MVGSAGEDVGDAVEEAVHASAVANEVVDLQARCRTLMWTSKNALLVGEASLVRRVVRSPKTRSRRRRAMTWSAPGDLIAAGWLRRPCRGAPSRCSSFCMTHCFMPATPHAAGSARGEMRAFLELRKLTSKKLTHHKRTRLIHGASQDPPVAVGKQVGFMKSSTCWP